MLNHGNANTYHRFTHPGHITFKFFHVALQFFGKVIFKNLYKEKGVVKLVQYTLQSSASSLTVSENMMVANANKDFFKTFLNAFYLRV